MEHKSTASQDLLLPLHSNQTSYVLAVVGGRYVTQRYWGQATESLDALAAVTSDTAPYLTTQTLADGRTLSLDRLPLEYPTLGAGRLGPTACTTRFSDGARTTRLEYRGHSYGTQPELPVGMPLLRPDHELGGATCLRVELVGTRGLALQLHYATFDNAAVLLRWARFVNHSEEPFAITDPAAAWVGLPAADYERVYLAGRWAHERQVLRAPLVSGLQRIESSGGATGHQGSPFVAVCASGADEQQGRVYAAALSYSGNYWAAAGCNQYDAAELGLGVAKLETTLLPGESFDTPGAVLVHSDAGFGGMSAAYHDFVRRGVTPRGARAGRRVVINTWEAMYFDVSEHNTAAFAEQATPLGAELLVLDDGWFSQRRDDTSSLGDWDTNTERFPAGLGGAQQAVGRHGLDFGIWMEPEMVSPDSRLATEHPDWVLGDPQQPAALGRGQLILDLANPEVIDHLIGEVGRVIRESQATHVKWDMNRNMSDAYSRALTPEQQGEAMHRYILGLYRLLGQLTTEFPQVTFEGCAGGGGRIDLALAHFHPRFWTSDMTDAYERLEIQYGSTLVMPPELLGAHVSTVPNHQIGRSTPARTRVLAALAFWYGFELDPARETQADREIYAWGAELFRRHRDEMAEARFVRLAGTLGAAVGSGRRAADRAWMLVGAKHVFVFWFAVLAEPDSVPRFLRLPSLPAGWYRDQATGLRYDAALLGSRGLALDPPQHDYAAQHWILERAE